MRSGRADQAVRLLPAILKHLKRLRKLNFTSWALRVGSVDLVAALASPSSSPPLSDLSLNGCSLTPSDMESLVAVLRVHSVLTRLSLDNNPIGGEGLVILAPALADSRIEQARRHSRRASAV